MDRREQLPLGGSVAGARFVAAVILVGLAGGTVACALRHTIQVLGRFAFGLDAGREVPGTLSSFSPLWKILVPTLGGLLAGAVGWAASRLKGGHGIPEIMEAVTLRRGVVSFRAAATKALAGILSISSGGSVGREGPLIQLSAALGSRLGVSFRLSERQVRILCAAGCAAGFAAAYDAPIGAVIFVAEVVAGSFALELLLPTMVATGLATMVTRAWFGSAPTYRVPPFQLVSWVDAGVYALLGLVSGVAGHAFLRALALGERTSARLALPRPLAGALGGLAVGAIGVFVPEVYGNGFEATSGVLTESFPWGWLLAILLAKAVATTVTVSSGAPGGVFTPTLLLGACLGGLVGAVFGRAATLEIGSPGSYALVGMAALLAATTHAPVLASVVVFEMTDDYAIVLPLLLATSLAVAISRVFSPRSIYTRELARRGLDWEGTIEERLARAITARDLAVPEGVLLPPSAPFGEIRRVFAETRARCVFVGDERTGLLGAIDLHAVKLHLDETELDRQVVAADLTVPIEVASPGDTLLELSEKMHRLDFGDLPVVESSPFALLGVVTRRQLLAAFDREILRRDILVTKVVWREGERLASELLELPAGARIAEIRVPRALAGRTLSEVGPQTEGVSVIAVVRATRAQGEPRVRLPLPALLLERGDRLVVLVPDRAAA